MCNRDGDCPTLAWPELLALTEAVTHDPRWHGRPVLVGRLHGRPAYAGWTVGRVVRYAPLAPACTVPHELAHVMRPDDGHDRAWLVEYLRLGLIADELWTSTLAARGPQA